MLLARAIGAIENPADLTFLETEEVVADLQAAYDDFTKEDTAAVTTPNQRSDLP